MIRLFLVFGLAASAAYAAEKPDLVFIIVDDLNDWIGATGGHPQTQTPNLDALAARGILMIKSFAQFAII
ncbi:hypothetical protein PQO01_09345 [Lentisphaera marina]|uniref:hypothetical protein n=1 Tax=Lentisphaera marina TaxID=1111041 RepID=UPI002365C554|nr:hypothetical protein [Lentisphaera marina]MDD7985153.1 hypothetical protein [Lentisphaera marina]